MKNVFLLEDIPVFVFCFPTPYSLFATSPSPLERSKDRALLECSPYRYDTSLGRFIHDGSSSLGGEEFPRQHFGLPTALSPSKIHIKFPITE